MTYLLALAIGVPWLFGVAALADRLHNRIVQRRRVGLDKLRRVRSQALVLPAKQRQWIEVVR